MSEQLELIKKAQTGDKLAGEKLIIKNSGLIWSIVKRYINRGVEQDDLYQLACLGFIKAVNVLMAILERSFQHMLCQKLQEKYADFCVMMEV